MSDLLRLYELDECSPRDGYPFAWKVGSPRIPDLVRRQAGNRCIRCGHPYATGGGEWSPCDEDCTHGAPIRVEPIGGGWAVYETDEDAGPLLALRPTTVRREAQWRILTVHHLTGDKADCRWWNLVALCQRCHLQIQGKVNMAQVWPHEHSEWFRPYAAGFYAATYLGEDLDRKQTMDRLDELLELERVA